MILKNDNLGLLCGTFLGGLLGSIGTILVLKKLKKLEEKEFNKAESQAVNEVTEYYEKKLNELKNVKIFGDVSKLEKDKNLINEIPEKPELNPELVVDKRLEKIEFTSPKTIMQERQAEEELKKTRFDYSKISKARYEDLTKEYEREEPDYEEVLYPKQITQEQFNDEIAYRKENLIYYEQDGVFAGYDDISVNDVYDENYFGADNLALLGTPEASLDGLSSINELYLRDATHNVDFHIVYDPINCFSDIESGGSEKD